MPYFYILLGVTILVSQGMICKKNDLNHTFRSHSQDVRRTRLFAESSGVVSAVLKQIPNQPTKFVDAHPRESDLYGNGGRYEDGILAKSWRMFIDSYNSGNPDYELLVWIFTDIKKMFGLDL